MKTLIAITVSAFSLCAPAVAQEFLRGDVNGDGKVTLADCYYLVGYVFGGGPAPGCMNTGDIDDDGAVIYGDPKLLFTVFSKATRIPEPYPDPGADPIPNQDLFIDCKSPGGGKALVDETVKLTVLDAEAVGGTDGTAMVRIALSNSKPVGAYRGTIDLGGIIANFEGRLSDQNLPLPDDLSGTEVRSEKPLRTLDLWSYVRVTADTMDFGFLRMQAFMDPLPPGDDLPVLEFKVCLAEGVRAGRYPIRLTEGEVVDAETGLTINPTLVSGFLEVKADVKHGFGCQGKASPECPPPVGDFRDLRVEMRLPEMVARPGELLSVPLKVFSTADLRGFGFSVDYNEEVLAAVSVDFTFQKPDGTPYLSSGFQLNIANANPGSGGIDEGFVGGGAYFSFEDDCNNVPANVETEICRLNFAVKADAPPGAYPLRFLNGIPGLSHPAVSNRAALVFDLGLPGDHPGALTFLEGTIYVTAEEPSFRRGDTTGDGLIDITDPVESLAILFLGRPPALCPDAADANDDGTLDLTDPVFSLAWLYLGGEFPASPGPFSCGPDPTADGLAPCFYEPAHCQ